MDCDMNNNQQQQQQPAGASATGTKLEELYGGAIVVTVPQSFTNVSDLRQVPDNQEVFMDEASGASLIIELMERVKTTSDNEAVAFHFQELARMNKAQSADIIELSPPSSDGSQPVAPNRPERVYEQMCIGKQRIAKFNEEGRENDVAIFLALKRISPPIATDLLVSISYAFNTAEGSSETQYKFTKKFASPQELKDMGANIFSSLQIRDFSLFVPEPEE